MAAPGPRFARIKKGVTPYGGRLVTVILEKVWPNGRQDVGVLLGEDTSDRSHWTATFGRTTQSPRFYSPVELEELDHSEFKFETVMEGM